jgi:tyrosinase
MMAMKLLAVILSVLLGSSCATTLESDALAVKGRTKLALHIAGHGYPNPEQCTLKNVAVRKEW